MNRTVYVLICTAMIMGILTCAFLIGGMLIGNRTPSAGSLRGARFVQEVCFRAEA